LLVPWALNREELKSSMKSSQGEERKRKKKEEERERGAWTIGGPVTPIYFT
jgi:hypothetical protein